MYLIVFSIFVFVRCAVGRHSQTVPGANISASPNAVTAGSTAAAAAPALKSISDYNAQNPTATSAVASAAKIISAERKSSRSADGLTAKCQRKGCQKTFQICDNCETACVYHRGQPVFHDAVKIWSCCPDKKCYDFDEFLAVPGCALGFHDDGVVELDS